MQSKKMRAAFSAFLIAGVMLIGAACGGSSNNSGSSSDTSAKSGSGSDASACADLFNKTEELAAKMDAADAGTADKMSPDMSATLKSLESFASSVPSEIRDDWKTVIATIKTYAEAIAGIDYTNLTDPTTAAKLAKAGSVMDDAKYQKASENLDQWTKKNCPSFDF
jgi:hypothetical protein